MSREIMCQMGNCLEIVGQAGVSVTLRSKDRHEEQKAVFCCAGHAALSLLSLACNRGMDVEKILQQPIPRNWKSA